MKTAISIPDELFEELDRLARRLKKPRSRLYAQALREYLDRHDADAITEAANRVCDVVDTTPDPFVRAAAYHALRRIEW